MAGIVSFTLSYSQITITSADFPSADDTVLVSVSYDLGMDVSNTGTNHTWDFSTLSIDEQRIDTFYNVSSASIGYQAVFNNQWTNPDYDADYYQNFRTFDLSAAEQAGVTIERPVQFVKFASSQLQNVGMGFVMNGYEIPAQADTIDIEYNFPVNYNDNWESRSYIHLDLNPAFNGEYVRHQQRYSDVDGWGTVTTPFGTFTAIRVRSEIISQDSVYVDPFGWFEVPTPDIAIYSWMANGMKMPVLRITTEIDGGNETVTSVEFPDKDRQMMSVSESNIHLTKIYPNPASDQINISWSNQMDWVKITDVSGKVVYENNNPTSFLNLDVSNWNKGMYFVKSSFDNKEEISKFIIQ